MADKKLTDLPSDASPTGDDYTLTTDSATGTSKKLLLSVLGAFLSQFYTMRRLGVNKKVTTGTVLTTDWVTYATVTATSLGREVEIDLRAHGTNANSGANRSMYVRVQCDGVNVDIPSSVLNLQNLGADSVSGAIHSFIYSHTPSAGSHTWTFQAYCPNASAAYLNVATMKVTELGV